MSPSRIASAVVTATLASVSFRLAGSLVSYAWLAREQRRARDRSAVPDRDAPAEPVVLLLPAFGEQSLLDATIDWYTALDHPPELVRVLVVTTERERDARADLATTLPAYIDAFWTAHRAGRWNTSTLVAGYLPRERVRALWDRRFADRDEVARAVTDEFERTATTTDAAVVAAAAANQRLGHEVVHVVETPAAHLGKVGQLRYAIDHLDEILKSWERVGDLRYVGVYDFDARPARHTLAEFSRRAATRPDGMQQVPFFVTGPREPTSTTAQRLFSVLDGVAHTRRTLGTEVFGLLADSALARVRPPALRQAVRPLVYGIGSGLYVDRYRLAEVGGLPEVVDDLGVGHRIGFAGGRLAPIAAPLVCETYADPGQSRNSRRFVYKGTLGIVDDFRAVRPGPAGLVLLARGLTEVVCWPVAAPAFVACALHAVRTGDRRLAARACLVLALLQASSAVSAHAWARLLGLRLSAPETLAAVIGGPVQLLWRGQGPRSLIWGALTGRREADGKTAR